MSTSTITAVALKSATTRLVSQLVAAATGKMKTQLMKWKTKAKIDAVYKKQRAVRFVKTIWQAEKAIDLLRFYYPASIVVGGKPCEIEQLSSFGEARSIVLRGTAGQGKSICMRYLAAREMLRGAFVPLFIELRRVGDRDLLSVLVDELSALGFSANPEVVEFLASNSSLALLLDGFDEVPDSRTGQLIGEIESLLRRFENLRIVVSSRSGSGIESSNHFTVHDLCPLDSSSIPAVIGKLADDAEMESQLIDMLPNAPALHAMLTTPLMVALLVVRFRIDQSVPDTRVAFYQNLVPLLLLRHDRLKAGYRRERKSGLTDAELQDVFDAVAFVLKCDRSPEHTRREVVEGLKKALSLVNTNSKPDYVLDDFIGITCLMVEDGGECRYLHKSVQEFHAAAFLSRQEDDFSELFYGRISGACLQWEQELDFLGLLDPYRFALMFKIPLLGRILETHESYKDVTMSTEDIVSVFILSASYVGVGLGSTPEAPFEVGVDFASDAAVIRKSSEHSKFRWLLRGNEGTLHSALTDSIRALQKRVTEGEFLDREARLSTGVSEYVFSLAEASDTLEPAVRSVLRSLELELADLREYVSSVESRSVLLDDLLKM